MSTVVVIGVGALGSHLVLLGRNWKETIRVVDFDRIEMKNTQAQFHSKMGLRQNKAVALAKALGGLFGTKIETRPTKLTDDNAETLLGDAALVVDCTDNMEARRVISEFVRANDIPCVHGALSADGTFARVIWNEQFVADHEGAEDAPTCEDGEHLPFFTLAAAQLAVVVQRCLDKGTRMSLQITPTGTIRLA